MATKTRQPKPAFTVGRYTVWFAEVTDDGILYDLRRDGEHYEAGLELEDAKAEAARLDREDRVTALREQLEDLASKLDDDTDESIAKLAAAIAALK